MGIVDWTFRGVPDEYFNADITERRVELVEVQATRPSTRP